MARAPNVKGFAQDLLKGSPGSLTWGSACEDEPVYRIARRKKICVGRFGRLASIAGIFWPGCWQRVSVDINSTAVRGSRPVARYGHPSHDTSWFQARVSPVGASLSSEPVSWAGSRIRVGGIALWQLNLKEGKRRRRSPGGSEASRERRQDRKRLWRYCVSKPSPNASHSGKLGCCALSVKVPVTQNPWS